jgi:hypothetical protein
MGRLRCALATLVVGVLLVACSDDDPEPKVSDPTASAATSSATMSTSPATPASTLGPEETVRAWVDARNSALQDGVTTAAEALSSGSCSTCEESLQPIRDVFDAGGHFETAGWTVLAAKVDDQSATKANVSAGIEYAAGRTFPDATSGPVSYEAENHVVVFRLVREGSDWLLAFIGYLS